MWYQLRAHLGAGWSIPKTAPSHGWQVSAGYLLIDQLGLKACRPLFLSMLIGLPHSMVTGILGKCSKKENKAKEYCIYDTLAVSEVSSTQLWISLVMNVQQIDSTGTLHKDIFPK